MSFVLVFASFSLPLTISSVLQGEIRNLHKKLEIYRKNNDLMRRQLESVGSADHTISLENALAEKQMQIDQLTQELRTCKKVRELLILWRVWVA